MRFEISHTFDCDLQTFESLFLADRYLDYLQGAVSNIEKIELLSREEEGAVIRRRVRYSPKPGAYKVGPKKVPTHWTVFEEVSSYDKASREMEFSNHPQIPKSLRGKFTNNGHMRLESDGNGRTKRTISGEIKVSIFLLGKIAERIIYKAGTDLIEQEASALKQFLAQELGS